MMSIDIQPLAHWVNAYLRLDSAMLRDVLMKQDARLVKVAEALGVLRLVGAATEIDCPFCTDPPHRSQVLTENGQHRIFCLSNGLIDISQDEVSLLDFNRDALMQTLARATEDDRTPLGYYAGNRLVRLGYVASPSINPPWIMAYADGLEDENILAGVIDALAFQFPKGPGLIASPSCLPVNLPLPNHHRLIPLHELVRCDGDRLVIDHSSADMRLGRKKNFLGQPGRPTERNITHRLWTELSQTTDWPSKRRLQAALIISQWPADAGPAPAPGTIEKQIRAFERDTD